MIIIIYKIINSYIIIYLIDLYIYNVWPLSYKRVLWGEVNTLGDQGKTGPHGLLFRPDKVMITVFLFLFLLVIWTQVNFWYEQDLIHDLRSEEENTLILQANALSMGVNKRVVLLDSLASFTQLHNTCESMEEHFFDYAEVLYTGPGGIRNFAIAPGGVQQYVYPPEEAANVKGHDLINDSREDVRNDVELAISSGKVILSGPYELRQGGLGLVAREATFIDGEFFGILSMVIDMPVVFEEVGIDPESDNVVLSASNGTVFGNPDVLLKDPVVQTIYLYNKELTIARIPEGGWERAILKQTYVFKAITLLPVFLLSLMAYFVLSRQEDLTSSVAQRTRELKMEKELTQRYLDDSGVMFIMVNAEGLVILINRKVTELLGYEEEEVMRTNWVDRIIPEADRPMMRDICHSLMDSGTEESQYCECSTITKSGEKKLVLWHNSAIRDEDGELTGILAAGKDITEIRKNEDALKKYAEEVSIKNEQLKSLDMMKDEFISNISHELRTPMNSIKGFAEVLHSESVGTINPGQKKALDRIINASYKLEKLIDSLLYMASSKKETFSCSFSMVDLNLLLEDIYSNLLQDADSKGIRMSMDIVSSIPEIEGNEDHLGKVFWNLLNNAIKFTSRGGSVSLKASLIGDQVHISVEDNGIGIPEEKLASVFDDFYQVDGSPTRKYGGAGIGLFISKKIISTHGGDIWVESSEDKGTMVHVILPVDHKERTISDDRDEYDGQ